MTDINSNGINDGKDIPITAGRVARALGGIAGWMAGRARSMVGNAASGSVSESEPDVTSGAPEQPVPVSYGYLFNAPEQPPVSYGYLFNGSDDILESTAYDHFRELDEKGYYRRLPDDVYMCLSAIRQADDANNKALAPTRSMNMLLTGIRLRRHYTWDYLMVSDERMRMRYEDSILAVIPVTDVGWTPGVVNAWRWLDGEFRLCRILQKSSYMGMSTLGAKDIDESTIDVRLGPPPTLKTYSAPPADGYDSDLSESERNDGILWSGPIDVFMQAIRTWTLQRFGLAGDMNLKDWSANKGEVRKYSDFSTDVDLLHTCEPVHIVFREVQDDGLHAESIGTLGIAMNRPAIYLLGWSGYSSVNIIKKDGNVNENIMQVSFRGTTIPSNRIHSFFDDVRRSFGS